MSSHHGHHEPSQLDLYEGDQSKLYSGVLAHHGDIKSDESKKKVKKIWTVTAILAAITIVEVTIGLIAYYKGVHGNLVIALFLGLTLVKAGYITLVFMHLGDENIPFRRFVLLPLFLFVWFIIAFLADGHHWLDMNFTFGHTIKDLFL